MHQRSVESLFNLDTDLARATVNDDLRLDILERDVQEEAILTIARRQPMVLPSLRTRA
jgi:phosphate transport system protein